MTVITDDKTLSGNPTVAPRRRRAPRSSMRSRWNSLRTANAKAAPLPAAATTTAWAMVAISVLAGWFALYALVLSGVQERRDNAVLYSQLRQGLAEATTPFGGVIAPGTPIALIEAPVDGLRHTVLIEGTSAQELKSGPGHLRNTPLPGQPGLSVLYGRSRTFGAPFGDVAKLHSGERITVTTAQGRFAYRVNDVRRKGDPLPAQLAAGAGGLMLQSTTGSAFAPTESIYVDATLVTAPVSAPGGRLPVVAADERALHADTSALQSLVLWLQLLAVTIGVTVWIRFRWGFRQCWLVGLPLILAALWGTSGNVALLLPNLI